MRVFSLIAPLAIVAAPVAAQSVDPKAELEDLLTADRTFSARAAKAADPVAGLAAMFDKDVVAPAPGSGHAVGREAVTAIFRASPSYKDGTVTWTPVRGGVSADGTHGFTYGFLSVTGGDPKRRDRKYLSYWIKRPEGWRVVAYRQGVREAGDVSTAMFPPALPGFAAEPSSDAAVVTRHQQSVAAAEKSFSDRAQLVGLKKAFGEFGRADAMNMYAGAGFAFGLEAVTAGFKEEGPATINWSTDRSFAASSGDLAVSIGMIRPNTPKPGEPAGFPFFTVWKRDTPDQPWKYIAE